MSARQEPLPTRPDRGGASRGGGVDGQKSRAQAGGHFVVCRLRLDELGLFSSRASSGLSDSIRQAGPSRTAASKVLAANRFETCRARDAVRRTTCRARRAAIGLAAIHIVFAAAPTTAGPSAYRDRSGLGLGSLSQAGQAVLELPRLGQSETLARTLRPPQLLHPRLELHLPRPAERDVAALDPHRAPAAVSRMCMGAVTFTIPVVLATLTALSAVIFVAACWLCVFTLPVAAWS